MKIVNNFLKYCDLQAKKKRKVYWNSNITYSVRENVEGSFLGIWFQTNGCSYDRSGGCIMCDYSLGPETSDEIMINAVNSALKDVKHHHFEKALISPAGSMLDRKEVSDKARREIMKTASSENFDFITFETRAEYIDDNIIKEVKNDLGGKIKEIFIGLESSSNFINKYCINKGLNKELFLEKTSILFDNKIQPIANILLGIPFLTSRESYKVALNSVIFAHKNGIKPDIFLTHIKEDTLYKKMYDMGLSETPSLWLLIELVLNIPSDIEYELSWYKTYDAFNIENPTTTCPKCHDKVISALDDFNINRDKKVFEGLECECRERWKKDFETCNVNKSDIANRIIKYYELISNELLGKEYWNKNGKNISKEVLSDYKEEINKYESVF